MFKYNKLRGRIVEKLGTQKALAEAIDTAPSTLSLKMRGGIGFSQKDIINISKVLEIPPSEYGTYFFE